MMWLVIKYNNSAKIQILERSRELNTQHTVWNDL